MFLLAFALVACGGEQKKQDSPQPTSLNAATATVELPPTRIVYRTPTAIPQPTATQTPLPQIEQVAGEKSLALRFVVTGGGIDPRIDTWAYTGRVTLNVQTDGSASGSGILWPSPIDNECRVTTLGSDANYAFDVQGYMTYDGSRVRLNIELVPQTTGLLEPFRILCTPDEADAELVQADFLWPMLSQSHALTYTLYPEDLVSTVRYTEDLAARTEGALTGMLEVEVQLVQ
ncbi:MAG: hypothetical protein H6673_02865 [Anaerolineales bacterium]|nr:hypothetical protein [Anaerolineales bacterium]